MQAIEFDIDGNLRSAEIRDLVIAGWTGRDAASVEHHIAELEAIGVARPRTVPCFYRVGANLLTTATHLDFTGHDSSGEVEFVLLSLPMQRLCRAGCKGICPVCGQNRNLSQCQCQAETSDDRWSALKSIR